MDRFPPASRFCLTVVGLLLPTILAAQAGPPTELVKPARPVLTLAPSSYVYTSVLPGNARMKGCALTQDCDDVSVSSWSDQFTTTASSSRVFKDAVVSRQLDANHPADDPTLDGENRGRGNPGEKGNGENHGNDGNQGNSDHSGNQGNGGGNGGGNGSDHGTDHGTDNGNHNGNDGNSGSQGNAGDNGNGGGHPADGGWIDDGAGDGGVEDPGAGTLPTQTTPEPATMILLGTGMAGVAVLGRKRRR